MWSRRVVWVGLALTLLGCGGRYGRAVAAYEKTQYPEALAALEAVPESDWSANSERVARYALYRGLSHLAVGEAETAVAWLTRCHAEVAIAPDSLGAVDKSRLHTAWRALGLMPGQVVLPAH